MAPPGEADDDCPGPEDEWACLTEAGLEADLLESEQLAGGGLRGSSTLKAPEEELKAALKRGAGGVIDASVDTDVFFAAQSAMQEIAADLHGVVAEVEMLQFNTAALVASIAHGPLRPPGVQESGGMWLGLPAREVFGPDVTPPRPPLLAAAPSAPSSANSLQQYEQCLQALPQSLIISREIKLSPKELDCRQDEKDINRDSIVVNGQEIKGAEGGYCAAVAAIAAGLRAGEAAAGLQVWPEEAERLAAQLLLGALNRTCSGFAAFEEVLKLLDCDGIVVVSPESAAAKPLEAALTGGIALGRAHTRYAVHRADGSGNSPLAVIDAYFAFRVSSSSLKKLVLPELPEAKSPAAEVLRVPVVVFLQRKS